MNERIQKRHSPESWLLALDSATGEQVGLVIDLSLCGVHILAHEAYETDQVVPLAIQTPPNFDGPAEIHARAVCRWCSPTADGNYDVGMEIDEEVSAEELTALAAIYYRHSA